MSWRSDAFDVEQDQDLEDFEKTESLPVLSTPRPFPVVTCTPNAFRLVERTNRKAGIMECSTITVRQISRCYNERPVI